MLMNRARPQTCEEEAGLVDPDVTRECRLCYAPVPNTAFATYCPNCKVVLRCLHCGAPIIEGPVCARIARRRQRPYGAFCGPMPGYTGMIQTWFSEF